MTENSNTTLLEMPFQERGLHNQRKKSTNLETGLTSEELSFLTSKGYEILEKLGEGVTREAYLASYQDGNSKLLRVIKIPKLETDPKAVQNTINRNKRDFDLSEALISNEIAHPNIIEVVGSYNISGRTINAEAYYPGAIDLETLVKTSGPITDDKRFKSIANQIFNGLLYLENKGVLHRDIKPSNILITRDGLVKISDLQTAAYEDNIKESTMPTRGGARYAHLGLLLSLTDGKPYCAKGKTEAYSLAATLAFLRTGEHVFDYGVVESEEGKEVDVGERKFNVKLVDSNGEIKEKDFLNLIVTHDAKIKKALKKVPRKERGLYYNCLSMGPFQAVDSIGDFKARFDSIKRTTFDRIKDGFRFVPAALGLAGLLGSFGLWGYYHPREETPTFSQVIDKETYSNFSLDGLLDSNEYSARAAQVTLLPYLEDAKKRLEDIDKDVPKVAFGRGSINFDKLGKRLTYSWLRACYLHSEEAQEHYKKEKEEREMPCFVPEQFIQGKAMKDDVPITYFKRDNSTLVGTSYLKQLMDEKRNVAEVFSHYFSSDIEIQTARLRNQGMHFLPEPTENGSTKGYQKYLDETERKLINTATGLYLITNENGDINWDKMPKVDPLDRMKLEKFLSDYRGVF